MRRVGRPANAGAMLGAIALVTSNASALEVRVVAATHIEARVDRAATDGRVRVRGTLRDDVGTPITSNHVAIAFFGESQAAALALPWPSSCPDHPSPAPHVAPDEYVVDTDQLGSFCFETALGVSRGKMTLRFEGNIDHDPTSAEVSIDVSRPAAILAFDPEPGVISLDRPSFTTAVRVIAAGLVKQGWQIALGDERQRVLGRAAVDAEGIARISVETRDLDGPGAGELRAWLEEAPVPGAPVAAPVERHVRVDIELDSDRAEGLPEEGVRFVARARSSRGPVREGSIEAKIGDRSVGAASLRDGVARVTATFAPGLAATQIVTARYLPAAPWFEPGAAAHLTVLVRQRTFWQRAPLLLLALALVAWMLRGVYRLPWSRPKGARSLSTKAGAAQPVHRLREHRKDQGWTGQVIDAHDGEAIRDARVMLIQRTFPSPSEPSGRVLADILTDTSGRFELPFSPFPKESLLHIEAPWHATVEQPLPAPHELLVAMVSRRRSLLDRMVSFATREWGSSPDGREPTPHQVARQARRARDIASTAPRAHQIEVWARATENVAFGPGEVDEATEGAVLSLEPR